MKGWKLLCAALLLAGCGRDETPQKDPAQEKAPLRVETMAAPESGGVQEIVQKEFSRARSENRKLLVYVGASWCEPCQRFHEAANKGQLDTVFPGLRLLEFDLDRDRERLQQAGYSSKMIPLFVLPRADGTSSGEQIEGSIKGEGAVEQIRPRLQALLAKGG